MTKGSVDFPLFTVAGHRSLVPYRCILSSPVHSMPFIYPFRSLPDCQRAWVRMNHSRRWTSITDITWLVWNSEFGLDVKHASLKVVDTRREAMWTPKFPLDRRVHRTFFILAAFPTPDQAAPEQNEVWVIIYELQGEQGSYTLKPGPKEISWNSAVEIYDRSFGWSLVHISTHYSISTINIE